MKNIIMEKILKKPLIFLFLIASSCSYTGINAPLQANSCMPIHGPAFQEIFENQTFDVKRIDSNCNGKPDILLTHPIGAIYVTAWLDMNENRKFEAVVEMRKEFFVIFIDRDEDGKNDAVGYDYNFDFIIDRFL